MVDSLGSVCSLILPPSTTPSSIIDLFIKFSADRCFYYCHNPSHNVSTFFLSIPLFSSWQEIAFLLLQHDIAASSSLPSIRREEFDYDDAKFHKIVMIKICLCVSSFSLVSSPSSSSSPLHCFSLSNGHQWGFRGKNQQPSSLASCI